MSRKHVVNVKNDSYRSDNPSWRTEKSKCHKIQVMYSFMENDIIFLKIIALIYFMVSEIDTLTKFR